MMELTELKLNEMMAELEGCPFPEFGPPDFHDWRLLGPLMVKYRVEIDYLDSGCSIWHQHLIIVKGKSVFKSESEIPRAIILCILKSEKVIP